MCKSKAQRGVGTLLNNISRTWSISYFFFLKSHCVITQRTKNINAVPTQKHNHTLISSSNVNVLFI